MKEKPILFSTPMVRAILDGSKTQTRRIVNPCAEVLWVKETFALISQDCPCDDLADCKLIYRADTDGKEFSGTWPWKPSIFMPRKASRITLEIVSVREERLQEISESDAKAEGVQSDWCNDQGETPGRTLYFTSIDAPGIGWPTAKDAFKKLWDSLNAKRAPWESNPFVYVIEFKHIKP